MTVCGVSYILIYLIVANILFVAEIFRKWPPVQNMYLFGTKIVRKMHNTMYLFSE